jgi:hypothetical protein
VSCETGLPADVVQFDPYEEMVATRGDGGSRLFLCGTYKLHEAEGRKRGELLVGRLTMDTLETVSGTIGVWCSSGRTFCRVRA